MEYLFYLIVALVALGLGYWLRKQQALSRVNSAEAKADNIVTTAKTKEKQILLEAEEKALKVIQETKQEAARGRQEINEAKTKLEKRENLFSQKLLELQEKQQALYEKVNK